MGDGGRVGRFGRQALASVTGCRVLQSVLKLKVYEGEDAVFTEVLPGKNTSTIRLLGRHNTAQECRLACAAQPWCLTFVYTDKVPYFYTHRLPISVRVRSGSGFRLGFGFGVCLGLLGSGFGVSGARL